MKADAKKGTPTAYYLFNKKKEVIAGPEDTVEKLLDTPKLKGKQPKGSTILAVPEKTTVISCDATTGCPGVQQADAAAPTLYYLFKYDPENRRRRSRRRRAAT